MSALCHEQTYALPKAFTTSFAKFAQHAAILRLIIASLAFG
jgi:hypothetical protein